MKQAKINGKGQGDGHRLKECSSCSRMSNQLRGHAAMLLAGPYYLAEDQWILPLGFACEGFTVKRYRRKLAVFPPWR